MQVDGGVRTGRDVVIGALLGADEFGFATAPLIALGCIMMRKCHLNTCPVGVATQDPVLRAKFKGQPEHAINYFFFVAEEVREIMAALGYRSLNEMIGQSQCLDTQRAIGHWKARGLDFERLFHKPEVPDSVAIYHCERQKHGLDKVLDNKLIELAKPALEKKERIKHELAICNRDRTAGAMLSGEVARRYGHAGLAGGHHLAVVQGHGGTELRRLAGARRDARPGRRRQRLRRQGPVGRQADRAARSESGIVPEESIIVGNTVAVRRHFRRMLLPRRGRRALCGAQLRRGPPSWRAPAITAANT